MTLTQRFSKLIIRLPSAVAALAALGAMMLAGRDWAPQVGLVVYFSVVILMTDGFSLFSAEATDIS